jgi:hypothetical protein
MHIIYQMTVCYYHLIVHTCVDVMDKTIAFIIQMHY